VKNVVHKHSYQDVGEGLDKELIAKITSLNMQEIDKLEQDLK
jgi:hypothetical protein